MRCRRLCERMVTWAFVGSSLVFSLVPPAASSESAASPPDRMDALVASIALYPDPLLAKVLIAATYPLEVDEAEHWLREHKRMTGAALDRAIAARVWDDSIKDLARIPGVLSMMDDRLRWAQNLGDAFLAQPGDVFASVQRLRAIALEARTLHSTSQQNVTGERTRIVIKPAAVQVVDIPFYDPRVAYGAWPHPMYPPMWWTAPKGYSYGSGIGFMTGISVPTHFWRNTVDWDTGTLLVGNAVGPGDYNGGRRTPWFHNPEHRRFVSYSTAGLRRRYGRGFPSGKETSESFRGYDLKQQPLANERTPRTRAAARRSHEGSSDTTAKPRLSAFEDIDQGVRERLFSRRGNTSILDARRDNSHFAVGESAAAAPDADTVAAR